MTLAIDFPVSAMSACAGYTSPGRAATRDLVPGIPLSDPERELPHGTIVT
jgi:hypothetical protein